MSASDEQRRNIREQLGVTEERKKTIDPLFFSQECSDARICLRTGPVCMCGVEKMRTEILALRVVEQAARQMYLQYTDVEGIPFRTFEELWRGIGRALAALEGKP